MEASISRRSFFEASAVIGMGAVALSTATSAKATEADVTVWDKEADIVVVGSGTAAVAALSAASYGAESVIVLEKGSMWGGTTGMSGQGCWLPCSYCQADIDVEDDPETALSYLLKTANGRVEESVARSFIDHAPAFSQWSHDEYGWNWSCSSTGAADYYDACEGATPIGRTLVVSDLGMNLWTDIQTRLDENPQAEILMETPAVSLITDDGAVVGVIAEQDGTQIRIHAKRGVVLGTGSFDHNAAMMHAYQPCRPYYTCEVQTNTGDGHLMGMAVSAATAHMDTNWGCPYLYNVDGDLDPFDPAMETTVGMYSDAFYWRSKPNAVIVNRYGKRFGNESSAYPVFNRSFEEWDSGLQEFRNIPAFFIADSEYTKYYFLPGQGSVMDVLSGTQPEPGLEIPAGYAVADTLEELAEKLGIDPEGFVTEMEEFNSHAAEGQDPKYHRGEKYYDLNTSLDKFSGRDLPSMCLAPVQTPPFYGVMVLPGTLGTCGGLQIDENAQVVNAFGEPIPGLYATGNCSSGVSGGAYSGGGMTVGAGAVMAWVAARHIMDVAD